MFVTLKNSGGNPVVVNANQITYVEPTSVPRSTVNSKVHFPNTYIEVRNEPDNVKRIIEQAREG